MGAGRSTLTATAFLLLLSFQNSSAEQSQNGVQIFNISVQYALTSQDTVLHEPKNGLLLSSGAIAHNCNEYLAHRPPRVIAEGINNQAAYQAYLICDTFEAIRDRTNSYKYTFPAGSLGKKNSG